MQLGYCGNASSIPVPLTARGQPWAHAPQAMLSCGFVPSWQHGLLAGAGEVQALKYLDLFHLFPQPVISIAARVCNYRQLFMAGAWSWWDNLPAGSQRDPQARSPLWHAVRPGGCIPTGGKKGFLHSWCFQEPLGCGVPPAPAQGTRNRRQMKWRSLAQPKGWRSGSDQPHC